MPHINALLESIPQGRPHRLEQDGVGIVVLRRDAKVYAYHDVCPHAGWRLSDGEIVEGVLECPGHGWQFNVETGQCTDVVAYCLKLIRVTHRGDEVRFEWEEGI